MGCFLACFGTSKEEKRRNQRKHKLILRQQSYGIPKSLEHQTLSQEKVIPTDSPNVNLNTDSLDGLEQVIFPDNFGVDLNTNLQDGLEKVISADSSNRDLNTELPDGLEKVISTDSPNIDLNTELPDGLEEESILITRKKVTFDTNVKTYEPILVHESAELIIKNQNNSEDERDNTLENSSSLSNSRSEDDSITSSVGSYAPTHRYENCRDSDDDTDDFDCEDSDAYDENDETEEYSDFDEDENETLGEKIWAESVPTASMESRTEISSGLSVVDEVDSPLVVATLVEKEGSNSNINRNVRNRSVYVHSVLNPVENIAQWKAAKAKTTSSLKSQKENFTTDQEESRLSFSFMSKSDQTENKDQEISVDASLSSWLSTPVNKTSHADIETERSYYSDRSNSPVNLIEDRPILGALTVEEIKQFSASNSPRKSPSRSPDEMAIIGTVGRYWNSSDSTEDCRSISSSYKGIPNSTSKYREDKKVIWHSTPFETRLERALKRGDIES